MGDMGDIFDAMRQERKERRARNLNRADDTGWKKHTPYHWYRYINGVKLNYWPSSNKYQYGKRKVKHGNVRKFIEQLEAGGTKSNGSKR